MERAVSERSEYVRRRLAEHFRVVGVHHIALGPAGWDTRCNVGETRLVDRACGWADPVDAPELPPLAHDEAPIAFRYCPEIIARTTAELPRDGAGLFGLKFYIELIEHITDIEVAHWYDVVDPLRRRFLAEDAVYAIHPQALRFLSEVQAAALDGHLHTEARRAR